MDIRIHKNFKKSFDKKIKSNPKLRSKFKKRLELFQKDKNHKLLRDHPLKGDMIGYRSFSVTGDIRVIYVEREDKIVLVYIGTHNQVY